MKADGYRKYCPGALIEDAVERDYTHALALFVLMKAHLSHGWFRTMLAGHAALPASARNKELGYVRFTRLMKVLRREGLVIKENKKFRLLRRSELNHKYGTYKSNTVLVKKRDGIALCRYSLLHKLKEDMAEQQRFRISARKLPEKGGPKAKMKRRGNAAPTLGSKRFDKPICESAMDEVIFTHNYLSGKLKISNTESSRLNAFAKRRRMCRSDQVIEKLLFCGNYDNAKPHLLNLRERYGHVFYRNGYIVRIVGLSFKETSYWNVPRKKSQNSRKGNKGVDVRSSSLKAEVVCSVSERTYWADVPKLPYVVAPVSNRSVRA